MHLVLITNELATADCSSGELPSFTANIARIFRRNRHKVSITLAPIFGMVLSCLRLKWSANKIRCLL